MTRSALALLVGLSPLPSVADQPPCPAAITKAISKQFAGAKVRACKPENKGDQTQFEVKLEQKGGKSLEVDLAPDGSVLQLEEEVALSAVPAVVTKAFADKYGAAAIARAEKQTNTKRGVFYELAFAVGAKTHEATFAADGRFVEEE
jgi:hypothetical protein